MPDIMKSSLDSQILFSISQCCWIHQQLFTNPSWCCTCNHRNPQPSTHKAITFLVLTCLVQEIQCKKHHSVMVESKVLNTAGTKHFCDGSISENVRGAKLCNCTKFHAFLKKCCLSFGTNHLDYEAKAAASKHSDQPEIL